MARTWSRIPVANDWPEVGRRRVRQRELCGAQVPAPATLRRPSLGTSGPFTNTPRPKRPTPRPSGVVTSLPLASPRTPPTTFSLSSTGVAWSSAATPMSTASAWTAVAYGDHRFVAVDSTGDIAWSNSNPDCAAVIPTAPLQVSGNIRSGEVWTYMHPPSNPGVRRSPAIASPFPTAQSLNSVRRPSTISRTALSRD
jgi:hypothetical protein